MTSFLAREEEGTAAWDILMKEFVYKRVCK